jgi:hypothetical protein
MSWEKKNPTLALAMLIGGDTVYKDMLRVAFGMQKLNNMLFLFETKKPNVDFSRNILTALALKEKCEWIFFLDSDVVPPLDIIPRLLAHNLPIVTGLYWRRYENLEPCIYKMPKEGVPSPFSDEELIQYGGSVMEVEGCGAGCMLIHMSVFEKLMPSVEKFEISEPGTQQKLTCCKFWEYIVHSNVNLSEDIVLASRVKGLGYRIFADLSLRCGHLTNVMVKEGALKQTPLTTGRDI